MSYNTLTASLSVNIWRRYGQWQNGTFFRTVYFASHVKRNHWKRVYSMSAALNTKQEEEEEEFRAQNVRQTDGRLSLVEISVKHLRQSVYSEWSPCMCEDPTRPLTQVHHYHELNVSRSPAVTLTPARRGIAARSQVSAVPSAPRTAALRRR